MAHTRTKKSNSKRYLIAGIGAVSAAALVGAGVFATSLAVNGSAGTSLQAGTDSDVTVTPSCDTNGMTVVENFSESELNTTSGYPAPDRISYTVSGINSGEGTGDCDGLDLSIAIKYDGGVFQELGTWEVDATSNTYLLSAKPEGFTLPARNEDGTLVPVSAYSLKIS